TGTQSNSCAPSKMRQSITPAVLLLTITATDPGGKMPETYVGMMSGTSLDAIDAVLVQFDQNNTPPRLIDRNSTPIPPDLQQLLKTLAHASQVTFHDLAAA